MKGFVNTPLVTEQERLEIVEAALAGLYELVAKYAPREPPNGERFLPANGGHGIERELRIAREALEDGPFAPDNQEAAQ